MKDDYNDTKENATHIGKDILYKDSINNMTGIQFESLCAQLVKKIGFNVECTKTTGDGGIDLIAYNNQPLFQGKYIIQCKRWNSSIGEPIIRDLYGVVMSERANKGILITNSYFTENAISFANDKQIELIDGNKLYSIIYNYYINIETTSKTYVDMNDIYKWDEVCIILDSLKYEKNNLNLRMKLINHLSSEVEDTLGSYTSEQYDQLTKILEEQFLFFSTFPCNKNDKNMHFIKYTGYFLLGQIYLMRGKIDKAIQNINKIYEWSELTNCIELDNNLCELYAYSTYDMIQLLKFLGLDYKAKTFAIQHSKIINYTIEKYKRIILNQQLDENTKKSFIRLLDEFTNLNYQGKFYTFKYSWINDIDDVNHIYQQTKFGMQYTCIDIGYNALSINNDLKTGKYSKLFSFNEKSIEQQKKRINALL